MKRLAQAHSLHLLQSYTMWVHGRSFHTCAVACLYMYHNFISETSSCHLAFITSAITAAGRL